ncbi:hypothetical protein RhiJN_06879 [Ceratobasidium sp. AG-Ba]|nr:hypothetical protein RhiJN_06879 [Ceratobasidium sp. AG-Ba]QRW07788.1 hypothetical protein RhiLY_06787 [Ceratobasidium sp. AG-Ba]
MLESLTLLSWHADVHYFLWNQVEITELSLDLSTQSSSHFNETTFETLLRLATLGVNRWYDLYLVKNRPVSSVEITKTVISDQFVNTVTPWLMGSSTCLTRLTIHLRPLNFEVDGYRSVLSHHFFPALSFSYGSLQEATVTLVGETINQASLMSSTRLLAMLTYN